MKKLCTYSFLMLVLFAFNMNINAQPLIRVGSINPLLNEECGWGNIVAGVDLDKDGKQEIYAVNEDWNDLTHELIPKIVKYEFNGTTWDSVWAAVLDIPAQNSWPALTVGDLDGDGKGEIIWAPINYTNLTGVTNPNPARIVVFETKGDGSDVMGVPNIDGTNYLPNTSWQIVSTDNYDLRPFKLQAVDVDKDGKQELIFCDRATGGYHYGIMSVSDVPDDGPAFETWTMENSGLGSAIPSGAIYDFAVVDSTIYFIHTNGLIYPVTATAHDTYTLGNPLNGIAGGSWKSASVVDINNDGKKEIVAAGWTVGNNKVYLLQPKGDSLITSVIADASPLISANGRIMGGDAGDLDNNGKIDFAFGSRDAVPSAAILRLEYQSGDITSPSSYKLSIADSNIAAAGRFDIVKIANVDGDPMNELIYSNGIDGRTPLVIDDVTGTLPVELKSLSANVVNNKIELRWSTATEKNNSGFEVQRKSGNDFQTIAFVKGAGSSTSTNNYSFVDKELKSGNYSYRLKQVDFNGNFEYSEVVNANLNVVSDYSLSQNYPNPFNPSTVIKFSLPEKGNVSLKVFNTAGEEVASLYNNQMMEQGSYNVTFNAKNLSSGVYFYRLSVNGRSLSNKMLLLK